MFSILKWSDYKLAERLDYGGFSRYRFEATFPMRTKYPSTVIVDIDRASGKVTGAKVWSDNRYYISKADPRLVEELIEHYVAHREETV